MCLRKALNEIVEQLDHRIIGTRRTKVANDDSSILNDLTAQVADQPTVEQSVITLMNGLSTQLSAAAVTENLTQVRITAQQIRTHSAALAAAVLQNTAADAPPAEHPDTPSTGVTGAQPPAAPPVSTVGAPADPATGLPANPAVLPSSEAGVPRGSTTGSE